MATIYLVSQGEYSDYHIVGAYSTREGAEALAAYYNGPEGARVQYGQDSQVEEYEMDQPIPQGPRGFVASGRVKDGVDRVRLRYGGWCHDEKANVHYWPKDDPADWYVSVRAETEELARLLWADIRRAILAGTIVAEPESSNG